MNRVLNEHGYTAGEEVANSLTHGIGFLMCACGLAILVVNAVLYGSMWHVITFSIFGICQMLLFLASTLYHSVTDSKAKRFFKVLDHAAIFLLIAGTYTPVMLVGVGGALGWTIFGLVWGIGIAGIILKCCCMARLKKLSLVMYIGMGWLCVIALKAMFDSMPPLAFGLLLAGGVTYTAGVIFYAMKRLPYAHAVWHLFVLGGSTLHFFSVLCLT
ncbi:hemolysin III family protein [Lentisphaerota bacterium ZTH]|nr:hemolysin III family protein [Lentisphaerota bacterium]WET06734.1 hemolysin III family protein [Lentisphaerota bacterium ZTH]